MKMKSKKISMILLCIMLTTFLSGCGNSPDMAGYISAILDNSFKNDSTKFVSMEIGTAEQAAKSYETTLAGEVDALIELSDAGPASDEQRAQMESIVKDIYAKAKYTVDGAEKQDDGSYVVTVTYERANVYGNMLDAYIADAMELNSELEGMSETEMPSEAELRETLLNSYIDDFNNALANVTYDKPATATIRVELKNQTWQVNSADFTVFQQNLFDLKDALDSLAQ